MKRKPVISVAVTLVFVVLVTLPASTLAARKWQGAPSLQTAPSISGISVVGNTLTANPGTWSGSGITYSYQWVDCDTSGNNCTFAASATGSSYLVPAPAAGYTLRVYVTASDRDGSATATSAQTAVVVAPAVSAPTNTALPAVSGSAVVSQTLSASTGSWNGSPTSYKYQWRHCDSTGASCADISGGTSATYLLSSSDLGFTIRVAVTATSNGGSATATSAQTAVVAAAASTNPGFPSSYYTGPLGASEILPKSSTGALLIDWPGTIGLTAQQTRDMVLQRMSATGRTFDGVGTQLDQLTVNGVTSEQWIKSLGSFPFISWSPTASVANVAAGLDDAELASVANRLKSLGSPVMLRPWHEFNGTWFSWSATVSSCPTWISGWRHMVQVFQQNGATNVGFDWSPSEGADRSVRDACYPGDSYVDWVSSDGYNGCLGTLDWCTPLHGGWATFREIFDYTNLGSSLVSTYSQYGARKPFVVAETSSKCDPNDVNAKGNWFRNIDSVAKPAMPYLRGVEFFDQDVSAAEPGNDWKVDTCPVEQTSSASFSGWTDLSKTADFNVGY